MTLGLAVLTSLLAGQMLDGHVHRVQNGGVLVHCGGHVVEVVVRRRGEVVAGGPVASIEAWLVDQPRRSGADRRRRR
jgi:hypothetical protein